MMSGLLWLLVVFEGQESESESFARLTEITTSLLPSGGFSWDESSSSVRTNRAVGAVGRHTLLYKRQIYRKDRCTLSLDVRDVQAFLQPKNHHSKLQVKGITGIKNRTLTLKLEVLSSKCSIKSKDTSVLTVWC